MGDAQQKTMQTYLYRACNGSLECGVTAYAEPQVMFSFRSQSPTTKGQENGVLGGEHMVVFKQCECTCTLSKPQINRD